MKKLLILISAATVICFCAVMTQAQVSAVNGIKEIKHNEANCSLFFGQVLNSKEDLDLFEDEIEYLLETGYFWETCLAEQLRNYKDVTLNYTGYTSNAPTKKEIKRLIKSAAKFKEELKDYIKEQEPKKSFLHDGDKYIFLQADKDLNLTVKGQKYLKKENKKININSRISKIIINIKTAQNAETAGGILIQAQSFS